MAGAESGRETTSRRIALPAALERQLVAFRSLVGRVQLARAACIAISGIATCHLAVFLLDRVGDTPWWPRFGLLTLAAAAALAVPWAAYRWVWRVRSLEQVARLVGRRFRSLGDQLLGIIEIVREHASGILSRSPALCEAAIRQVAERVERHDLRDAVPPTRLARWAVLAVVPLALSGLLAAALPQAAGNAWARLLAPWRAIPRFTFTRLDPLPAELVVPHGERTALDVRLAAETLWRPRAASARAGRQQRLAATLTAGPTADLATNLGTAAASYAFTLPPQLESVALAVAAGDARQRVALVPLLRPEITAVEAEVVLPGYLERPGTSRVDVRGGTLAPVVGSTVALVATANRPLAAAEVDGAAVRPTEATVATSPRLVERESTVTIGWTDRHGLAGARLLEVRLVPRDDTAPTVGTTGLPVGSAILLESDTLAFSIAVADDFGVRRVGIEWEPYVPPLDVEDPDADPAAATPPGAGERVLEAGGPERESLDVAATFCPQRLGIAPQPLLLRAFAEDYLPGRDRARSSPVLLYVVDREEHAFILNEQLNRWRQQAGEVRDREMALLAANRELRSLPEEALGDSDTRDRIQSQAAAERANARRLERLVDEGAGLVQEAVKNPEFEAALLESLAADIETLSDIAATRMPGVADLLRAAAQATPGAGPAAGEVAPPGTAGGAPGEPAPGQPAQAGQQPPPGAAPRPEQTAQAGGAGQPPPPFPSLTDRESSQQPPGEGSGASAAAGQPRFGLPTTQAGVAPPGGHRDQPPRPAAALDAAIAAQEALLAEFAKVAEDLAAVMARLEGSTFVKRFKLASREQGTIGGRLAALGAAALVRPEAGPAAVRRVLDEVVDQNTREAEKISNLMDDLQAYFERRRLPAFRTVLEEMKDLDALGSLRQLSDDIRAEAGLSIAQSEFWSDTFDRLADDLVPPPDDGTGESGEGQSGDVPPEVVLEVLRILEAEMNLREETRVVEQSRDLADATAFADRATALAREQHDLGDRMAKLADTLIDAVVDGPLFGKDIPLFGPLPIRDGRDVFKAEIALFDQVEEVMREAADILARPDTGPEAIGAETEVIELLLASRSAGGGGGGGGGMALLPGGGGTGTARTPAIANLGRGNRSQRPPGGGEEEQATGVSGRQLPEEFRSGLDDYFNRVEQVQP
jgi:hypothetical protein